nr:UDP-N-acetylmuramoyl-tripeptide--D-alanyl-D-alanine ligase [uncultured Flavobacterium sp.]
MRIEDLYQCFLECDGISTDTRNIQENSLFIALKGDNFNANSFAKEALLKGAKYVIIDDKEYFSDVNKMLLVEDSLKTLQALANFHRNQLGLPIIALTGSNGKTTSKELILTVLSKKYNTKATVGNLNNHIGVPLTLLSFNKDTDLGIVEMGANHQKEIELLCKIAQPDFGYITNFGRAHLEGFGGLDGVIAGKSEMYTYLENNHKMAFINLDDPIQVEKTMNLPIYSFSFSDVLADVCINDASANPMAQLEINNTIIKSNLTGTYNLTNIAVAATIGNYFNISDTEIKEAIASYFPTNNRSQWINQESNKILLDAYNANPSSMTVALENFAQLEGDDKIIFLGDMFELGSESSKEHQKIIELAQKLELNTVFVGNNFYLNKNEKSLFFEDFENLSNYLKSNKISNKTILIKGSRGMALERILNLI